MTGRVAAVIVTHEASPEIAACVGALAPQVEEIVVVANFAD